MEAELEPARSQEAPYGLRMPKGMREHVKRMAAANGRSMNSEIVFCLRKALMATGVEFGDQPPAAATATENSRQVEV